MSLEDCKAKGQSHKEPLWHEYNAKLDAHFTTTLDTLEKRFERYPSLTNTWKSLRAYLSNKGKRIRPLLFLSSYDIFSEDEGYIPDGVVSIACALEIFHTFALIHDDVIDESHSRRGEPTLHVRLHQESIKDSKNSNNLAIVLGDVLFGFAMECFVDMRLPSHYSTKALRYFLKIAQDTGLGQAIEIVNLEETLANVSGEEILDTYCLKTTRYTIEGPVLLGAIMAGADQEILSNLRHITQPLGLAFQIKNDLHELNHLNKETPLLAYDLKSGVKTYLLKCFYDALSEKDRLILENCLRPGGTTTPLAQISKLLNKTTVEKNLKAMTNQFFKESMERLEKAPFQRHQTAQIKALVGFLGSNSHHSEAEDSVSPVER